LEKNNENDILKSRAKVMCRTLCVLEIKLSTQSVQYKPSNRKVVNKTRARRLRQKNKT